MSGEAVRTNWSRVRANTMTPWLARGRGGLGFFEDGGSLHAGPETRNDAAGIWTMVSGFSGSRRRRRRLLRRNKQVPLSRDTLVMLVNTRGTAAACDVSGAWSRCNGKPSIAVRPPFLQRPRPLRLAVRHSASKVALASHPDDTYMSRPADSRNRIRLTPRLRSCLDGPSCLYYPPTSPWYHMGGLLSKVNPRTTLHPDNSQKNNTQPQDEKRRFLDRPPGHRRPLPGRRRAPAFIGRVPDGRCSRHHHRPHYHHHHDNQQDPAQGTEDHPHREEKVLRPARAADLVPPRRSHGLGLLGEAHGVCHRSRPPPPRTPRAGR
ncbi:hypothetical protein LZ32DRAFT_46043 [Colletotrichum eremochloae]|nr:hypothetical protein LZ32DRAFT_46043 [Colletotrichum eremochloae]